MLWIVWSQWLEVYSQSDGEGTKWLMVGKFKNDFYFFFCNFAKTKQRKTDEIEEVNLEREKENILWKRIDKGEWLELNNDSFSSHQYLVSKTI